MTTWFSPGRIEVLGKHTDYAGGRCLIMALDRGVTATVTDADAFVRALVRSGIDFRGLAVRGATLEEAFLALTETERPEYERKDAS